GARRGTSNEIFVRGVTLLKERDTDRLGSRLHLDPELEADVGRHLDPLLERIGRLRLRRMRTGRLAHEEHRHFIELGQLYALAVERDLELFTFGTLAEDLAETELQKRQFDQVLAIDGEVVADVLAAAGPEWLPLERLILPEIPFHRVGALGRRRVALPDGEPADLRRCRNVSF